MGAQRPRHQAPVQAGGGEESEVPPVATEPYLVREQKQTPLKLRGLSQCPEWEGDKDTTKS